MAVMVALVPPLLLLFVASADSEASLSLGLSALPQAQVKSDISPQEISACEHKGGVVVSLSLSVQVVRAAQDPNSKSSHSGSQVQPNPVEQLVACVPQECSSLEPHAGCRAVRRSLAQRLLADSRNGLDGNDVRVESSSPETPSSWRSSVDGQLRAVPWFIHGDGTDAPSALSLTYDTLRLPSGTYDQSDMSFAGGGFETLRDPVPSLPLLAVAVLGTHGPLSTLAGNYLLEAAVAIDLNLQVKLYGQCYLCQELSFCRAKHVPSRADNGCDWFHMAPERDVEELSDEVQAAAQDIIAAHKPGQQLAGVVCLGLLLCHFVLAALPASAFRMQIFCMNPLQGTPEELARPLLQAAERRWVAGQAVLTTNAVTSALFAYHAGRSLLQQDRQQMNSGSRSELRLAAPPAILMLPSDLRKLGLRSPWSHTNGELLLARNFLLMHDPTCVAFEEALRSIWPHPVHDLGTHWDFSDEAHVRALLQHRAVVFIPEHPYKNVFNDFYAVGLPIFVPNIRFLARLWPQVRHIDSNDTYDGWFDRRIPKVQLQTEADIFGVSVPEPFDMRADGAAKVGHWLQLADFYHFPGVHAFVGLAMLIQQISSADLEAARDAMRSYSESQHATTIRTFRALLQQNAAPSFGTRSEATVGDETPTATMLQQTDGPQPLEEPQDPTKPERWPPFEGCLAPAESWTQARHPEGMQTFTITRWVVRLAANSPRARELRLQVWRPIRVGWQQGARTRTFQLVGENRVSLEQLGQGLTEGEAIVWQVPIHPTEQITAKFGDVYGWAVGTALGHTYFKGATPVNAHDLDAAKEARGKLRSSASAPWLCVGQLFGASCRWWPLRRVCNFQEYTFTQQPLGVLTIEAESSKGTGGEGGARLALTGSERHFSSIAFELSWSAGVFALWALEYVATIFANRVAATSWTFFVCPPPVGAGKTEAEATKAWRKVVTIFGCTVGASLRCGGQGALQGDGEKENAEAFLHAVDPFGPWPILSLDTDESTALATQIASHNPSGLGIALRALDPHSLMTSSTGSCKFQPGANHELQGSACLLPVEQGGHWTTLQMQELLMLQQQPADPIGVSWTIFVFSCIICLDLGKVDEPKLALNALLGQAAEAVSLPVRKRSVGEVLRLTRLRPALDVLPQLDPNTTYEEFMTLRQQLPAMDLTIFEDKIQLRRNLLRPLGVEHTPDFYMSNEDPNILQHISGLESYVVKPSHMTESEHVAVVHQGRHVFDIRVDGQPVRLGGTPVDAELLQQRVLSAWKKSAYEWECQAVTAAKAGVIVERLVLATLDPGAPEVGRVEEARCHVVWGRVMAVEWAVGRQGSMVMADQVDRAGRHSMGADGIWAVHLGSDSFRDPDGWAQRVEQVCLPKIMAVAERVANGAHVDHLRVDLLVEGPCETVYVSEVELFPAVPFAPKTMAAIEQRWRYGYGID